jgi:hypothetical protein
MFFDPVGLLISTLDSLPYRDNYTTPIGITTSILVIIPKLEQVAVFIPVVLCFFISLFYTMYTLWTDNSITIKSKISKQS